MSEQLYMQDPSLLDFQNAELLFIGASSDIKGTRFPPSLVPQTK